MSEYEVEEILDKKIIDGHTKYLVKWKDWDLEDSTWEPRKNLKNVSEEIEKFERKQRMNMLRRKAYRSDSESESDNQALGNIEYDIPKRIKKVYKESTNAVIMAIVEWNKRYDGSIPKVSSYPTKTLRKRYHSLLLDYYEDQL